MLLASDGVNDYMTAAGMSITDFTLFMVLYVRNRTNDNAGIFVLCPPSGNDYDNSDGFVVNIGVTDNAIGGGKGVWENTLDINCDAGSLKATPQLLTIRAEAGYAVLRVNGIPFKADIYSDITSIDFTAVLIGGRFLNGITGYWGNVDYSKILLYGDVKNDRDVYDIENSLKVKWGIS